MGAGYLGWRWWTSEDVSPQLASYQDLAGCRYTPVEQAPLAAPTARLIPIPEFPGSSAIWGATGRDNRGHIWFGVCADGVPRPSAHLFEYDPTLNVVYDRGNVVAELQRLGLLRAGERQMKIHSRIVQAEDGHLYFASMDEEGENVDGSALPTWGSHLWRLRLPERRWEWLQAFAEGVIAVCAAGRYVNALGYFNHIVHQYDCRTRRFRSKTVGAAGGHISRNFFCDHRGHVFVPRLAANGNDLSSSLVELSPELQELNSTPLSHYTQTRDDDSHGITAFQPLADRSIIFSTDQGYLYRVEPAGERATVRDLGFLHPRGTAYVGSLFTSDGQTHVMGLGRQNLPEGLLEWLIYNLQSQSKHAVPIAFHSPLGQPLQNLSLYGSVTRDDTGACYVGGIYSLQGRGQPALIRIS